MDNTHPESVVVVLGGETRRLRLGPAAFRLAKLRHDTTVTMAELSAPSLDTLAQLVWIALLPSDPDLEEVTVLQWMAEGDEGPVLAAILQALARMTEGLEAAIGGDAKKKAEPETVWPDLDEIDRMACALLNMTPRDVDACSFRDLWVMFAGAREREQARWRHTLALCQSVYNWGGPRDSRFKAEPLSAMYDRVFGAQAVKNTRMSAAAIRTALSSIATPKQ